MAAQSKAWVCGRSRAGISVSNSAADMDVCECCVLSGKGTLFQKSPTECSLSEGEKETS